jgi:hypothetical protein
MSAFVCFNFSECFIILQCELGIEFGVEFGSVLHEQLLKLLGCHSLLDTIVKHCNNTKKLN